MSEAQQQAEAVTHHDDVSARMRTALRNAKARGVWDGNPQTAYDVLALASHSFSLAELIEYGHDAAFAVSKCS